MSRGWFRNVAKRHNNPKTDWMLFEGECRDGDSGGPIFTTDGRVAGILWGKDPAAPRTLCGVQQGRVTEFLNAAYAAKPVELASGPTLIEPQTGEVPVVETAAVLPYRKNQEQATRQIGQSVANIEQKVDQMRQQPPPQPLPVPPPPTVTPVTTVPLPDPAVEELKAQIKALQAQKEEEAKKNASLSDKLEARLKELSEQGGLKGKVAEKVLAWHEDPWKLAVVVALGLGLFLLYRKKKTGKSLARRVSDRHPNSEALKKYADRVDRIEGILEAGVHKAVGAVNPVAGGVLTIKDVLEHTKDAEQRLKDWVTATLKPAPSQTPQAAQPGVVNQINPK